MKTKHTLDSEEINLVTLAQEYADEDKARALLESWRWPNGPVCPHCGNKGEKKIYELVPKATSKRPGRKGLRKCGACRRPFSVTVGTVFEASHIPISKWLMAFFIISSSKKGISAHQMHRMSKVSYKSCWFMCHRIRYAMWEGKIEDLLTGTVEVDETFCGGRGDARTKHLRKTPLIVAVERGGRARTKVVADVTQKNVRLALREISKDAIVNTDQAAVYTNEAAHFKRHDVVNHSQYEYARRMIDGSLACTNTAESFFSLIKRGIMGSFHHVSREHLARYADEFAFRWTHRKLTDGQRMEVAIEQVAGKRLTYKQVV